MALQAGTVEVPVEIVWSPRALRAVALEKALQLRAADEPSSLWDADRLIQEAKKIEEYLNGPDPQQTTEPDHMGQDVPDDRSLRRAVQRAESGPFGFIPGPGPYPIIPDDLGPEND